MMKSPEPYLVVTQETDWHRQEQFLLRIQAEVLSYTVPMLS